MSATTRQSEAAESCLGETLGRARIPFVAVVCLWALVGCDSSEPAESASPPSATASASSPGPESDDRYDLKTVPEEIPTGRATDVRFVVRGGDDLHVNREYPNWRFRFDVPDGLELEPDSIEADQVDVTRERAAATASVTVDSPGRYTIEGRGNFSVCNDQSCHILDDTPLRYTLRAVSAEPSDDDTGVDD